MQQNFNTYPNRTYPAMGANAVNINIISPQAYASAPNGQTQPSMMPNQGNMAPAAYPYMAYPYASLYPYNQGFYPIYGQNQMPSMPLYPQNYNNMMNRNNGVNPLNAASDTNLLTKTSNDSESTTKETSSKKDDEKEEKTKKITPLTDDYIKSLENYMNNDNPKIRLIGAKDLMERFKEDENRKDNPSLIPLLNKALRDPSPAVRFLALTTLQTGYCVGNDETVQILKEIQLQNKDKIGEDALLASEILLKMSAPQQIEVNKE